MIDGLSFEYAHARVAARLGQRPDERLWAQLRSARTVPALLEALRASPAASTVSGVAMAGDADSIELAFRQQLRTRIDEVAGWAPAPWRPALLHLRHLVDLPALLHLLGDEPSPPWIAADPVLARYAQATAAQRRTTLLDGPLAALVTAFDRAGEPRANGSAPLAARRLRAAPALHRLLAAWEARWRALWPIGGHAARAEVDTLVAALRAHLVRFPGLRADDAGAARQTLAARLATAVRRNAGSPAALFAYLALFAVDLERLRAEFLARARPVEGSA